MSINFLQRISSTLQSRYRILHIYLMIALLAPLIASHDPLVLKAGGRIQFPAFSGSPYVQLIPGNSPVLSSEVDWRFTPCEFKILPLICYSPSEQDAANTNFASPFKSQYHTQKDGTTTKLSWRYRHWMGTTRSGQDVLSILLHGCRTSLIIGIFSMLLAAFIGLLSGLFAGYYGNDRLKIQRINLWGFLFAGFVSVFYSIQLIELASMNGWRKLLISFTVTLILLWLINKAISIVTRFFTQPFYHRYISIPVDKIFTAVTITFISLPRLVLVLSIAAILKPSITSLILLIGCTAWAEPARLIRTETRRIRNLNYIEHAHAAGSNDAQILLRHALPNLSSIVRNIFLTGAAGAIMTEAGLSFIGIGLPYNTPSWGMLIHEAKRNAEAWWLIVIPGIAIGILLRALLKAGMQRQQN